MESSLLLPQAFTTAMATATTTARPCGWRSRPRASSPPHRLVVPSVVCASSSRSALSLHGGGTLAPRHVVPAQEFLLSCCSSWRRDAGTLEEDRPWQRPAGVEWSSGGGAATAPPGARAAALPPMAWAMAAEVGMLGTAQVSLPLLPEDGAEAHFPFHLLVLLLLCAYPSLQFLRPKSCHVCFASTRLVPWLAPKPALPFPPTSRHRLPPCPAGPGSGPPKDKSKSLLAALMMIWSIIVGSNERVFLLSKVDVEKIKKNNTPAEGVERRRLDELLKAGKCACVELKEFEKLDKMYDDIDWKTKHHKIYKYKRTYVYALLYGNWEELDNWTHAHLTKEKISYLHQSFPAGYEEQFRIEGKNAYGHTVRFEFVDVNGIDSFLQKYRSASGNVRVVPDEPSN